MVQQQFNDFDVKTVKNLTPYFDDSTGSLFCKLLTNNDLTKLSRPPDRGTAIALGKGEGRSRPTGKWLVEEGLERAHLSVSVKAQGAISHLF